MIEVTMTEIALFIWAIGATAMWLQTRDELRGAKHFIRAIVEDENIRNKLVAEFKKFKESQT